MSEKVLITGGGGFVGTHLAHLARQEGCDVHIAEKRTPRADENGDNWHLCDLLEPSHISKLMGRLKPDYVFHLAAVTKGNSLKDLFPPNVLTTENLLESARVFSPSSRIIVAGSAAEYGWARPSDCPLREESPLRPLSPYGISKTTSTLLAVQYALRHSMGVLATRSFNLTGPGEPETLVCGAFSKQIAEIEAGNIPPRLKVGNLDSMRDFTDIRDGVRALWVLAHSGTPGEIYNICTGKPIQIREILNAFLRLGGVNAEIEEDPGRLTAWDVPVQFGSPEKIFLTTGWHPVVSIEKSHESLLDHWRARTMSGA